MKIIVNPPYNRNFHLKVLSKIMSEFPDAEIVNLSPIRWLQDPLAEYKQNSDWKTFSKIEKDICKLEIIDRHTAAEAFDATTETLGIYYFDGKEHNFKVDRSFGKRILERTEKFYSDYMNHKKTEFWCPVARYHWTSGIKEEFGPFTLTLSENGIYAKTGWTKGLHDTYEIFYFDTKEELENFKAFLVLPSYKWLLGKLLNGKRLSVGLIPMMPTYTHKWSNADLYLYFELTTDEIQEIETTIY